MTTAPDLFTSAYGRTPDGVWSAPGRVNLIGEHTDYNEGFVLPFAIDRRTRAAVGVRSDRMIRIRSTFSDAEVLLSLDDLAPGATNDWSAYVWGVAWALAQRADAAGTSLADAPGLDIAIDSDVPVGAGLSSSAAIESSVAVAMNELWGIAADRMDLARVGRVAENEAVGAPTGLMDQAASLMGEADHAVFLDCRSEEAVAVPLGLRDAGLAVLVVDTRVEHQHATGGYRERRDACERGAAALGAATLRGVGEADLDRAKALLDDVTYRRVRHVITENARVEETVRRLTTGSPRDIGDLLLASHASMRDDFEISVPELDLAVETAMECGAVGARMTGGGFGGSAIALVEAAAVESTSAAILEAFAKAGFGEPKPFSVVPSDGAHRD